MEVVNFYTKHLQVLDVIRGRYIIVAFFLTSLFFSPSLALESPDAGVEKFITVSLPSPPFSEAAALADSYAVGNSTFSGFLEPINPDGSSVFKLGNTIPVKFQLKGPDGQQPPLPVPNSNVRIFTAKVSDRVMGTDVETASNTTSSAEGTIASRGRGASAADANEPTPGNHFIYDPSTNEYVFNIGTNDLSPGTWQIKVMLDDGSSKTVNISLIE